MFETFVQHHSTRSETPQSGLEATQREVPRNSWKTLDFSHQDSATETESCVGRNWECRLLSIDYSLIDPDGGSLVDLVVSESQMDLKTLEAESMPKLKITKVDLEWVHVLSEGWASPLKGFMREDEYLQSLHFNCLRMKDGSIVNMSLPIVLAIDDQAKERIGASIHVALVGPDGDLVGVLRSWQKISDPESIAEVLKQVYADHSTEVDKVFSCIHETAQHPAAAASFVSIMFAPRGQLSFWEALSRCQVNDVPICLMYGKEDPWVKPVWGLQVKRRLPEAPYYEISPAGHCPHDEVPE
ncbi:unnamed protein product [Camellia sinensis]